MATKKSSDAAKVLSRSGAAKGGRARANTLTPTQRSEAARKAVTARWEKAGKVPPPPKEPPKVKAGRRPEPEMPFSMYQGTLSMGKLRMRCHVLNDGRRVFTQAEVTRVLTGSPRTTSLQSYLANLKGFNPKKLEARIAFRIPRLPRPALGYEAPLMIDVCDAYVDAWNNERLHPSQESLAKQAEIIIRACAKVGIIALIDEATGYQKVRKERALQIKLQAFIADEMQEWARLFPTEFWHELARLENVHYSPSHRPLRWGQYVMAFVYDAIDKDVANELRQKNPNPQHGQNHHQWLKEHGKDAVRMQINKTIGIMQSCDDMAEFKHRFAKVLSRPAIDLTALDDLN